MLLNNEQIDTNRIVILIETNNQKRELCRFCRLQSIRILNTKDKSYPKYYCCVETDDGVALISGTISQVSRDNKFIVSLRQFISFYGKEL